MALNQRILQSVLQKVIRGARQAAPAISKELETSGARAASPFAKGSFLQSMIHSAGVPEDEVTQMLQQGLTPRDIQRMFMAQLWDRR